MPSWAKPVREMRKTDGDNKIGNSGNCGQPESTGASLCLKHDGSHTAPTIQVHLQHKLLHRVHCFYTSLSYTK